MSRTLSNVFKTAASAQETGEVLVALVTITHALILGGPLRLVQNLQDLTSNGNVYTAFPFQIRLPDDTDEGIPQVSLTIDSVDRSIMAAIRSLPPTSAPAVQVDLVLASQPNVVELSVQNLTLRNVRGDALQIEGDLRMDEEDLAMFPKDAFTPQNFPGMFI